MSDSTAGRAHPDGRQDPEPRGIQDHGPRRTTERQDHAGPDHAGPDHTAADHLAEPDRDPAGGAGDAAGYAPGTPRPLGVERTPTGNAEVDARLARLGDVDHLSADGHIEVYEDVHSGLRDALTALDVRPGPQGRQGPPPPPAASPAYDHRS